MRWPAAPARSLRSPTGGLTPHPLKPSRSRADTARAQLGTWVRGLGVDDPELSPNHSWRHTFKRIADEIGMPEKMNDAITGHTQATEGRKYGPPKVTAMAEALKKFPRYELGEHEDGLGTGPVAQAGENANA